jgi:hypothetical protein
MHRFVRSALLAFLLLPVLVGTTVAKDNAQAELDAAIPRDAGPGTELDVAFRAWVPDGGKDWPFSGLAVFIRLTSPDGKASTEAAAHQDRSVPGRYTATVVIPDGGVGLVEVGMFGESCVNEVCTRSDLMFALPEEQRVPRAFAAPVAPPERPAPAAAVQPPAAAVQPTAVAAPELTVAAAAAATTAPPDTVPMAVAIITPGVLLLAVVAMTLARRMRTAKPKRG